MLILHFFLIAALAHELISVQISTGLKQHIAKRQVELLRLMTQVLISVIMRQ